MASETQGKVEEILKELGRKIDQLIEDTKNAGDEVKEEVEKKIADLKKKKEKLEEDFQEYKRSERWHEAKVHFSAALQELKKGVESIFTKGS